MACACLAIAWQTRVLPIFTREIIDHNCVCRNSQKPPDELLANFKASFPSLSSAQRSGSSTTADPVEVVNVTTSLTDALDIADPSR